MRRLAFFLVVWLHATVFDVDAQQPGFSKNLKDARSEFAAAMKKADEEFAASSKLAADTFKKRLKDLVDKETKAGNLDSALAIRDELKKVDNEFSKPKTEKVVRRWIAGRYQVKFYPSNHGGVFEIRPDGQILDSSGVKRGQLRVQNESIIRDTEETFERYNFCKSRLFIEHYASKADLDRDVVEQIGVATLLVSK